jgi:hypothetical protein
MSLAPELSVSEFSSLAKIGAGPLLDVVIPAAHVLKLVGYRYVEAVGDHYEATTTGRFRIASGS